VVFTVTKKYVVYDPDQSTVNGGLTLEDGPDYVPGQVPSPGTPGSGTSIINGVMCEDAFKVVSAAKQLYNGLTAASLTMTSTAPAEAFRVAVTLSPITGHTDVVGSVTVGSEVLAFTAATRKTTTTLLSARPGISCANLDCNILVECINSGGAPIYEETTTAIKVLLETNQSGFYDASGAWIKTDDLIMSETPMAVGDRVRVGSTDYIIRKVFGANNLDTHAIDHYEYQAQVAL
jgi:hypothetical protein